VKIQSHFVLPLSATNIIFLNLVQDNKKIISVKYTLNK